MPVQDERMRQSHDPDSPDLINLESAVREVEICSHLLERYGPLLNRENLMKVLGFATAAAFDRYCQRGHLNLRLVRPPNRRGVFAHARDVARYLIEIPREEAGEEREREK